MTLRLFLAIEPAAEVLQEAGRAADHLRTTLPGLHARYAEVAAAHLTLVFLGQVAPDDIAIIERRARVVAAATPTMLLRTADLGAFPTQRRPSVLWLGVEDDHGELARLQGALATELRSLAPTRHASRFVPHLTLARVSGLGSTSRADVAAALAGFEPRPQPWPVAQLVLFHSELRPTGARYRALARWPLGARRTTAGQG